MKTWLLTACFAGAALTLVPANVNAACAPSDLAGYWDVYSSGVDEGDPFWNRCRLRFGPTGVIIRGNCLTNSGEASTISGRLTFNGYCLIGGPITQHFEDDANDCEITQATLAPNKQTVDGVGTCNDGVVIFSLTMIRH